MREKELYNNPLSPLDLSALEEKEVVEVFKSGWITIGLRTKELEKKLAEYSLIAIC